jgi:D-beta-D-heptose 7-phosphate kinase/D-beta-D-heptose 1-phosphate adenosyltransferase
MRVSERRLRGLLGRFSRVRVLVVGDLMLDEFIFGRVDRISPEAPVPVVHVGREELRPGGAGNVVSNVRALGGRATACGLVGQDAAGSQLRQALRATGASTTGILATRGRRTTQKTRIIAHQQQVVRLDHEDGDSPSAAEARRLRDMVLRQLSRADVLIVSDYGKGAIGPELLGALAEMRRRRPFTWLIDPKRANFPHYRRASLVKPNRDEAAQASGIDIRDGASLRAAGERLLAHWEAESVLISQGEGGMALFKHGPRGDVMVEEFPTVARQVFDVTGAGDTVLATCALALGAGGSLEEATVLANHAAGVVVGRVGTATTTTAELRAAMRATRSLGTT